MIKSELCVHIHLDLGAIADGIAPFTWNSTLYFWHMKDEISGQVRDFILINYICSSAVYIYIHNRDRERVCVGSVSVDI